MLRADATQEDVEWHNFVSSILDDHPSNAPQPDSVFSNMLGSNYSGDPDPEYDPELDPFMSKAEYDAEQNLLKSLKVSSRELKLLQEEEESKTKTAASEVNTSSLFGSSAKKMKTPGKKDDDEDRTWVNFLSTLGNAPPDDNHSFQSWGEANSDFDPDYIPPVTSSSILEKEEQSFMKSFRGVPRHEVDLLWQDIGEEGVTNSVRRSARKRSRLFDTPTQQQDAIDTSNPHSSQKSRKSQITFHDSQTSQRLTSIQENPPSSQDEQLGDEDRTWVNFLSTLGNHSDDANNSFQSWGDANSDFDPDYVPPVGVGSVLDREEQSFMKNFRGVPRQEVDMLWQDLSAEGLTRDDLLREEFSIRRSTRKQVLLQEDTTQNPQPSHLQKNRVTFREDITQPPQCLPAIEEMPLTTSQEQRLIDDTALRELADIALASQNLSIPHQIDSVPIYMQPSSESNKEIPPKSLLSYAAPFTENQANILRDQLAIHVQLLTQQWLLAPSGDDPVATSARAMLKNFNRLSGKLALLHTVPNLPHALKETASPAPVSKQPSSHDPKGQATSRNAALRIPPLNREQIEWILNSRALPFPTYLPTTCVLTREKSGGGERRRYRDWYPSEIRLLALALESHGFPAILKKLPLTGDFPLLSDPLIAQSVYAAHRNYFSNRVGNSIMYRIKLIWQILIKMENSAKKNDESSNKNKDQPVASNEETNVEPCGEDGEDGNKNTSSNALSKIKIRLASTKAVYAGAAFFRHLFATGHTLSYKHSCPVTLYGKRSHIPLMPENAKALGIVFPRLRDVVPAALLSQRLRITLNDWRKQSLSVTAPPVIPKKVPLVTKKRKPRSRKTADVIVPQVTTLLESQAAEVCHRKRLDATRNRLTEVLSGSGSNQSIAPRLPLIPLKPLGTPPKPPTQVVSPTKQRGQPRDNGQNPLLPDETEFLD